MKVRYFSDTDTALVEFTENEVVETKELSENIYIDLDRQGKSVQLSLWLEDRVRRRILQEHRQQQEHRL